MIPFRRASPNAQMGGTMKTRRRRKTKARKVVVVQSKRRRRKKESSKKTKVQQKKVEDKPIPIKKDKDKSKSRNHKNRPPKGFDEDISLDMSLNKLNKKRVKLSSNILIETKIVEVKEQGKENFSFPALVFVKKMSDGKLFEFNLPLNISVKLQDALEYINAK